MRNYLIMVEGPHDVAAVSRCIKLCGITREYKKQKEVPQLWQRLIPTRYPFDGENLDRIAQQPTFMGNEDISVAIKAARSDVQLLPELERICHELKIDEKAQISGVLLTKTSHTSNGNCSLKIQQYRQSDNKLSPCSRSG